VSAGHDGRNGLDQLVQTILRPPYTADLYGAYATLREGAPVYRAPDGLWLASTYDTATAVFRSPTLGQGSGPESRLRRDPRYGGSPALQTLSYMLPFIDPPDHTRLRRLISRAFTPPAVERMRSFLTVLADRLLDRIGANGGGELMKEFADHIPVSVICEMLGAPADRHADLVRWGDALVHAVHPTVDDEGLALADDGAARFAAYVEELIAERRVEPQDDLLTALVQTESDGDTLDAPELVSTVVVFIGAGIENTKHYIGSCIAWLLRHPDQLALVRADPSLLPAALEEVLRLEPPVQISLPRLALDDTAVGNETVPAGERVSAVIAAANRDPAAYDDPDRFDIGREGPPNLSLASGAHYCTGAGLARLEANVAVERFLARFPRAELVSDTIPIRDDVRPSLRGYAALHVQVEV
jgi:cytochrome P450